MRYSTLHSHRLSYQPKFPSLLKEPKSADFQSQGDSPSLAPEIEKLFPKTAKTPYFKLQSQEADFSSISKVGVLFSGGQAAGGHNVIAGLFDALSQACGNFELIGFLDGPAGVVKGHFKSLTKEQIDSVRNQGGFDLIGSGREKIETEDDFKACVQTVQSLQLQALIIIGGDDSNTNAAFLAEHFLQKGVACQVIGIPKTIDGDLRSAEIEISFGFDSACKTYAELIGNIARDAKSAKKYYHFIKLMGRSASHIALECALATQPNLTLIGEERKGLQEIVGEIADLIEQRKKMGKEYGVILIPEGLIEFIPEMQNIAEKEIFSLFPKEIQEQLLLEKDPHGNVQVSQIQTEKLLIDLVKKELKKRAFQGKFNPIEHFFGYEGRSCLPSNFDSDYTYSLGRLAAIAILRGKTGVLCALRHLNRPSPEWEPVCVPIVQLMHLEQRKGKLKAVIAKYTVNLKSQAYVRFCSIREGLKVEDSYVYPGPIQFFGDREIADSFPTTLGVQ